jgi:hypothetical protein
MRHRATEHLPIIDGEGEGDEEGLEEIARRLLIAEKKIQSVKTALEPQPTAATALAQKLKEALLT